MPAIPLPTHDTVFHDHLPEVVSMPEAVAILGRTSSRIRQMVDAKNFKDVYRLGDRPTYFFNRAELEEMAAAEKAAAEATPTPA